MVDSVAIFLATPQVGGVKSHFGGHNITLVIFGPFWPGFDVIFVGVGSAAAPGQPGIVICHGGAHLKAARQCSKTVASVARGVELQKNGGPRPGGISGKAFFRLDQRQSDRGNGCRATSSELGDHEKQFLLF